MLMPPRRKLWDFNLPDCEKGAPGPLFFLSFSMIRIQTGSLKGTGIPYKPREGLRPTTQKVRESVVNILKPDWAGAYVADLFAGTGAYGLEALSNGAEKIVWVEKSAPLVRHLEVFLEERFPERRQDFSVRKGDVLKFLESYSGEQANIVLLDPPYGYARTRQLLSGLLQSAIVGPDTIVVFEHYHKDNLVSDAAGREEFRLLKMYAYGESHVALLRRNRA